jgi:NitT/TauT family transport system substrate-binding protein
MTHLMKATVLGALIVAGPVAAQDLTTVNAVMPKQRSANYFPLIVGEALGYFEDEGIEVNLLPSDTPIPFVNFLRNGQADIAMLDSAEVLQALAAGVDLNVVYEVMQSAPDGIAVSGTSDVKDVEQLRGQTVGLVSDRDRVTMQIALDARGMTEDDVTTVVVGEAGPTLAAAFRDQTVAAIAGSGPDWLAIQAAGIPVALITPEEVSNKPGNTFAVVSGTLDDKGELIEGYLRAWSKGMYAAKVDPEAVAKMAQAAVPEEWEDAEFGQQYLNNAIRLNVSVTDTLGGLNQETWAAIQPAMQKFGMISEQIDPTEFLASGPVEAANEFDRDEVEKDLQAWREANM